MAPDLAFLKSEMTATTVITPTTAKRRQWYRQLHLASIRRVVPLTSARRSTAGGTQDLIAAARAAMDEAVDRFTSYADSGVPAFGGKCVAWWVRSIQRRASVHGFCCSCICICICCRYRRSQYRDHIRSAARLSGGATGGADTSRTRGDGSARLRLLPTLFGVRPHGLASGLFVLRGEGVRAWARAEGMTVKRKLSVSGEGTVVAAASGQRLHDGMSPTGGVGETQCTSCKTTIIPLWRRDPQGQPLCNAYGSFFVSVHTNVGSRIILTLVF